jgi:RNase P subunit RPR2
MAQPALAPRPRYTPDDIRVPGMTRVHCVGCGEVLFEYRAAIVRLGGTIRKGMIVARCKRARCHHFNRFEVPDEPGV